MRLPVHPRVLSTAGVGTYTGFGSGTPAGIAYANDEGTAYTLGTAFKVTTSGLSLTKGRLYLTSNSGAISSANICDSGNPLEFTLYGADSAGPGAVAPTLFTQVQVTSVTLDAWTEFTLGSPYALTSGTVYYASVLMPFGRYSAVSNKFTSDVVNGPITFPSDGSSQGGTGTVKNGAYRTGSTIGPPGTSFNASWYGIDVEVA